MAIYRDLAEWRGPSPHRYEGGMVNGGRSRGLVVHIASGFYQGTIAWQLDTSAGDPTSSHWIVARDGRITQMLDTGDASWAQATGNRTWHSVECEGFGVDDPQHGTHPGWERLTAAQVAAVGRLYARGHTELGWPMQVASSPSGAGLGHHSMGAPDWGHASCPGDPIVTQKPAILAAAQGQPPPAPIPHTPGDDMIRMAHERGSNVDWIGNGIFRWASPDPDHTAWARWFMSQCGDPAPTSVEVNPGTLPALGPVVVTTPGGVPTTAAVAITDPQVAMLAAQITAHHDTLTDADQPAIEAAIRAVLHAT